ncbi:MAG TPA: type II 3-dehydroquinate dehydratase [Eubacteriales bacterium]|jgi:3-dehydroquinate dehydratase-2|nr:type II 3-dehydroquinate dehydratase [Clostridia bacterium]HRR90410.1 type II 3-dehydroquinate dehydratase [Eubacteriales bacterium]HRU84348.1 type II 3-dehydroquinate dehydratase [Eubacteriales bacterium]
MKKVLVINGPNLNMLGVREPQVYGTASYGELTDYIQKEAGKLGLLVECFQTNHEGAIIDKIQSARGVFDGIIINAGGYTHTSIAILDALTAVGIDTVEVHLSDIFARESFRRTSYISHAAKKTIAGKGFSGYREALEFFK